MTSTRGAVSLIVCTANRPDSLREMLASLAAVRTLPGRDMEVVIVDNAPEPPGAGLAGTAAQVVSHIAPHLAFPLRYVPERIAGLSRARNRGLAAARGEILLMTDDDVRLDADYLLRMTEPIIRRGADAVAGGVRLAPHLVRPWMTAIHLTLLASTEGIPAGQAMPTLIGANMAFHRHVLDRVQSFDVELGAGTCFGGEEILFSFQLREAGYRIESLNDTALVEHHCDPSRLRRDAFFARAVLSGRERAYLHYHFEQEPVGQVRRNMVRSGIEMLAARRSSRLTWTGGPDGMPEAEIAIIHKHNFYRQYLIERRRPRNYDRRGLIKRHGILTGSVIDGAREPEADNSTRGIPMTDK